MRSVLFDTDPGSDTCQETESSRSRLLDIEREGEEFLFATSKSFSLNSPFPSDSESKSESESKSDSESKSESESESKSESKSNSEPISDSLPPSKEPPQSSPKFNSKYPLPHCSSSYPWVFRAFLASNLIQYLLIFLAVPFSDVENRPPVFVLSCLLGSLSFVLSALMLPAGLVNAPTSLSHTCSGATAVLKAADVIANVVSVVVCLNVDMAMVEYHIDRKTHLFVPLDITQYIQVMSILLLASAAVSMMLALLIYLFNCMYLRSKVMSQN